MSNHNLPGRVNGRRPGGQKITIVTCSWWKAVTPPLRNTLGTSKHRKGVPATDRVVRQHCIPTVRNKYALGASTLGEAGATQPFAPQLRDATYHSKECRTTPER